MSPTRCALAEALATFVLVFAGTGAVVVDQLYGGELGVVGIGLCFGLAVMTMIYAVGDVSGAHMNPAVTIAFACARRFAWHRVPLFILAQCLGAILASGAVLVLLGNAAALGATVPADPSDATGVIAPLWLRAGLLEILFSWVLMFVILGVTTGAEQKGLFAGLAIGGTVALLATFGGPATGASMNPARSLGPALVSGELMALPLYLIAPVIGTALAAGTLCMIRPGKCCPTPGSAASCC